MSIRRDFFYAPLRKLPTKRGLNKVRREGSAPIEIVIHTNSYLSSTFRQPQAQTKQNHILLDL